MMTAKSDNSIEVGERLVGGEWHYKTGSIDNPPLNYHVSKKGLGGTVIDARSYSNSENPPKEVSHGIWFWHPGEGGVKAVGITKFDADASMYEYTKVNVEGNKMIFELTATGEEESNQYLEEWDFPDDDHYLWKLYVHTADGNQLVMEGEFERRNNGADISAQKGV